MPFIYLDPLYERPGHGTRGRLASASSKRLRVRTHARDPRRVRRALRRVEGEARVRGVQGPGLGLPGRHSTRRRPASEWWHCQRSRRCPPRSAGSTAGRAAARCRGNCRAIEDAQPGPCQALVTSARARARRVPARAPRQRGGRARGRHATFEVATQPATISVRTSAWSSRSCTASCAT